MAERHQLLDSETFGAVAPRCIGPAVMSGRIAAIAVAPTEPMTIWVGSASGGLWKSADGGAEFVPVFDDHVASIGAIAVDPTDPDTVWVGTGETWVRNSVSIGRGVYRTTDGGDTWRLMGLERTERIARIIVHPSQPDTVFVAATGQLWNSNPERGVYRTSDGGKSWQLVLFVDDDTGCADLAIDPQQPEILYAAMWQFRRQPDFFTSGGPGSDLYRSKNAGDSWQKLSKGLPEGNLGRIGIAVAPSRPSRVYAVVEAEEPNSGLFRSDDLGGSWIQVNSSSNVTLRPFYFGALTVDPEDYNRVYKPGTLLTVSTDGGKTFSQGGGGLRSGGVHPDYHVVWVNPKDPLHVLVGTDGGLYESRNRGGSFTFVGALPVAQFYHVAVDDEHPYNVYGGLQDNGSWMGPSSAPGGVRNFHWQVLGRGDGFWVVPDPQQPDTVYLESQGGEIARVNRASGEGKFISPLPAAGEPGFRFNWNTPIHLGHHRPGTLYIGSQFLHRSRDRGESWSRMSGDLTTDDPDKQRQESSGGLTIDNSTAENHCTIYSIAESPLDENTIWVGTDDGNLQVTADGGESWTNVVVNVPDLPTGTWVSWIEASPHNDRTAFASFDGHRHGDMTSYVYVTHDLGASWQALASHEIRGYCHIVRQDPENENLLFVGTELGLFMSIDDGASWVEVEGGFPNVAVRDLAIHPREHDLVIATHGRGVWILDDLTPIRQLSAELLQADAVVLDSRPSILGMPVAPQRFDGDGVFIGDSPADTATITYYLKGRHIFGDMRVEIYSPSGELVTTMPGGKRRGINRVDWPMRAAPPASPRANSLVPNLFAFKGPRVLEGVYTVKLIKGGKIYEGTVELVPDPRSPHSADDRKAQHETVMRLYHALDRLAFLGDAVRDAHDQLRAHEAGLPKRHTVEVEGLANELEALHLGLVASGEGGRLSGQKRLREKLSDLYGDINGYEGRPTESQLKGAETLIAQLNDADQTWQSLAARFREVNSELTLQLGRLSEPKQTK